MEVYSHGLWPFWYGAQSHNSRVRARNDCVDILGKVIKFVFRLCTGLKCRRDESLYILGKIFELWKVPSPRDRTPSHQVKSCSNKEGKGMHRNQSPASFTPNIYSLLGISNEELAFESRSFIFALLSYWFAFVF